MRLLNRMTNVQAAYINSVGLSSVFQIGDSCTITPTVKALAVQREAEIFFAREGNLNEYPIFSESIPQPTFTEVFQGATHNECPSIQVKGVHIAAISSSAVTHFGSTDEIRAEARVKHIRQLLQGE